MISKLLCLSAFAIVLCAMPLQTQGAVVFVQTIGSGSFTSDASGNPASFPLVVTSPVSAGDTVVMQVAFSGLSAAPQMNPQPTDNRGNSYLVQNVLSSSFGTDFQAMDIVGSVGSALVPGDVITVSFVPGSMNSFTAAAAAQEFSGVSTTQDGLHVTSGGEGGTTVFDTVTSSGPLVTTNADDLIYGFVVAKSDVVTGVQFSSSTPLFTLIPGTQSSGISILPMYSTVTATGNYGVSGSIDFAGSGPVFTVFLRALKAAAVSASSILSVHKSHAGDFSQGQQGANYQLTVSNTGTAVASGTISVTDTLPLGLTFDSVVAPGWTCSALAQVVTCATSTVPIAAQASIAISLAVDVAGNAPASVINHATVSCQSPCSTQGNPATDPTTIAPSATVPPVAAVAAPTLNLLGMLVLVAAILLALYLKETKLKR